MSTTTRRRDRGAGDRGPADTSPLNDVHLRGRLSAPPEQRELPSGDVVVLFRLIVDRPPRSASTVSTARVDTLDCAAFRADLRRRSASWRPGDVVDLRGSLRRRFFRTGAGPASRYEVEVLAASRVLRAGRRVRP
jgi:single-strand DNA-binding protein